MFPPPRVRTSARTLGGGWRGRVSELLPTQQRPVRASEHRDRSPPALEMLPCQELPAQGRNEGGVPATPDHRSISNTLSFPGPLHPE